MTQGSEGTLHDAKQHFSMSETVLAWVQQLLLAARGNLHEKNWVIIAEKERGGLNSEGDEIQGSDSRC